METVNYGCNKFYDTGPGERKWQKRVATEIFSEVSTPNFAVR